tara:strand:+ start:185 stop:481 length:297 start_codon:yes stop_codon:yes gene_type:complete
MLNSTTDLDQLESTLNLIDFLCDVQDYFCEKENIYLSANCEMYVSNLKYIWGISELSWEHKEFKEKVYKLREKIERKELKEVALVKVAENFQKELKEL